jgi:hypothetical protein
MFHDEYKVNSLYIRYVYQIIMKIMHKLELHNINYILTLKKEAAISCKTSVNINQTVNVYRTSNLAVRVLFVRAEFLVFISVQRLS